LGGVRSKVLLILIVFASAASGCGGDTTTINTTTIIKRTGEPSGGGSPQEPPASVPREAPRTCGEQKAAREIAPEHPGYNHLKVIAGKCEYARQVASAWVSGWRESCLDGCTKLVEGIRCQHDGGGTPVICSAARTGVRFEIVYLDV
jgi:hypothetical protein